MSAKTSSRKAILRIKLKPVSSSAGEPLSACYFHCHLLLRSLPLSLAAPAPFTAIIVATVSLLLLVPSLLPPLAVFLLPLLPAASTVTCCPARCHFYCYSCSPFHCHRCSACCRRHLHWCRCCCLLLLPFHRCFHCYLASSHYFTCCRCCPYLLPLVVANNCSKKLPTPLATQLSLSVATTGCFQHFCLALLLDKFSRSLILRSLFYSRFFVQLLQVRLFPNY